MHVVQITIGVRKDYPSQGMRYAYLEVRPKVGTDLISMKD